MWRIFVSLLALQSIFIIDCKAQLLIGPVASVGVSKVFLFDHANYDYFKTLPSLNLDGGIMASMVVHKNFVLNAQLLYSYRTKNIQGVPGPNSDPNYSFTSRMHYIELPIFYVLEFKSQSGNASGHGGRVKTYHWFVGGGPTISYWLSYKSRLRSSILSEGYIDHADYTAAFGETDPRVHPPILTEDKEYIPEANRFQFAINITGGLAFEPVGLHKIVTFAQFSIAQTFFAKQDVYLPGGNIDVLRSKNHIFKLSVAYLFDTKIATSKKGKSTKGSQGQKKRR